MTTEASNTASPPRDERGGVPAPLLADYLTREQTAEELHLAVRTLERWKVLRIGPPQVRIGARVYYHRRRVAEWLAQRTDKAA